MELIQKQVNDHNRCLQVLEAIQFEINKLSRTRATIELMESIGSNLASCWKHKADIQERTIARLYLIYEKEVAKL